MLPGAAAPPAPPPPPPPTAPHPPLPPSPPPSAPPPATAPPPNLRADGGRLPTAGPAGALGGMTASRRSRYNVAYGAISNGAFYSISASLFLGVVLGLELKFPARLVFAPGDKWREPFFYVCVIAWALLAFGVVFHCAVLALGRRRGYVLQLPRLARPAVVVALFWVALGLVCAALASAFVFLGMRARAIRLRSRQPDFLQEWALPVLSGIVPAILNALMALFTGLAGFRALSSVKTGSSRSRSSRNRSNESSGRAIGMPVEDDGESDMRPFDNYSELPSYSRPAGGYQPPPPPPPMPMPVAPGAGDVEFRPPTRMEIDGMLDTLKNMGFPSERENYAALYASNFDMQVATQRLIDAQTIN